MWHRLLTTQTLSIHSDGCSQPGHLRRQTLWPNHRCKYLATRGPLRATGISTGSLRDVYGCLDPALDYPSTPTAALSLDTCAGRDIVAESSVRLPSTVWAACIAATVDRPGANPSSLPTCAEMGELTRWIHNISIYRSRSRSRSIYTYRSIYLSIYLKKYMYPYIHKYIYTHRVIYIYIYIYI